MYDLNFPQNEKISLAIHNTLAINVNISCHWKSGFAAGSKEHLERCGGLTADVTRKMIELLNDEPKLINT